jgi:hypothetical protein
MSEAGKHIRKHLKVLEGAAAATEQIRAEAKKDSGHLTQFGRDLLAAGKKNDVQQAIMVRLLDISAGAVSQHYNK